MGDFLLEKVKKPKVNLNSFLDKKFLDKIKSLELQPINLIFVKHTNEMKEKKIPPQILTIGHENDKDVKENLIHVACIDDKLLKKFIDGL